MTLQRETCRGEKMGSIYLVVVVLGARMGEEVPKDDVMKTPSPPRQKNGKTEKYVLQPYAGK